jgi:hypothetical protein
MHRVLPAVAAAIAVAVWFQPWTPGNHAGRVSKAFDASERAPASAREARRRKACGGSPSGAAPRLRPMRFARIGH